MLRKSLEEYSKHTRAESYFKLIQTTERLVSSITVEHIYIEKIHLDVDPLQKKKVECW